MIEAEVGTLFAGTIATLSNIACSELRNSWLDWHTTEDKLGIVDCFRKHNFYLQFPAVYYHASAMPSPRRFPDVWIKSEGAQNLGQRKIKSAQCGGWLSKKPAKQDCLWPLCSFSLFSFHSHAGCSVASGRKRKSKETSTVTLIFPVRHPCPLYFLSIPRSKRACGVLIGGEAFVPPNLFLMNIFGLNFFYLEFQLGIRSSSFCCRLLSDLSSDSSTVSFASSTLTGEKELWQPRYEAAWR